MVFSSVVFLFAYLVFALTGYFLLPARFQLYFLLAANLVFYAWGEPRHLPLMLASILINYLGALLVSRLRAAARPRAARLALALTVAANLALLGYFKYAGFAVRTLAQAVPALSGLRAPDIALPIGISFYTFQSMSYVIDAYRGDVAAQRNPFLFGTYVSLYPQLIAGPIVRYAEVAKEMVARRLSLAAANAGLKRFVVGLSKKLLLANPMGQMWEAVQSSALSAGGGGAGVAGAWLGVLAFTFQIYFDFSGYSDMAVGLGQMLGFRFPENFDYPYTAASVTDFWRRWHITLSSWFRNYVYIPLGGNRKGLARQLANILAVWALTGLWHGASWNFVLWGLYFAALLVLEKLWVLKLLARAPRAAAHAYALFFIVVGWAVFSFTDFGDLGAFLSQLFPFAAAHGGGAVAAFDAESLRQAAANAPLMAVCALGSTPLPKRLFQKLPARAASWAGALGAMALFLLCVSAVTAQSYNPFIYFRF